eukprot:4681733-Amphidinium_carterae.1
MMQYKVQHGTRSIHASLRCSSFLKSVIASFAAAMLSALRPAAVCTRAIDLQHLPSNASFPASSGKQFA